jgi:hypothetical protein
MLHALSRIGGSDERPALWPFELAGRCARVQDLLAADPDQSRAQLREWRRHTLADLRLTRWALPE